MRPVCECLRWVSWGESGENPHEEDHVSNAPIYFRDRRRECLDGHNVRLYAKWGRACLPNKHHRASDLIQSDSLTDASVD